MTVSPDHLPCLCCRPVAPWRCNEQLEACTGLAFLSDQSDQRTCGSVPVGGPFADVNLPGRDWNPLISAARLSSRFRLFCLLSYPGKRSNDQSSARQCGQHGEQGENDGMGRSVHKPQRHAETHRRAGGVTAPASAGGTSSGAVGSGPGSCASFNPRASFQLVPGLAVAVLAGEYVVERCRSSSRRPLMRAEDDGGPRRSPAEPRPITASKPPPRCIQSMPPCSMARATTFLHAPRGDRLLDVGAGCCPWRRRETLINQPLGEKRKGDVPEGLDRPIWNRTSSCGPRYGDRELPLLRIGGTGGDAVAWSVD